MCCDCEHSCAFFLLLDLLVNCCLLILTLLIVNWHRYNSQSESTRLIYFLSAWSSYLHRCRKRHSNNIRNMSKVSICWDRASGGVTSCLAGYLLGCGWIGESRRASVGGESSRRRAHNSRMAPKENPEFFPSSKVSLLVNGQRSTTYPQEAIRYHINGTRLRQHLRKSHTCWKIRVWNTINIAGLGTAYKLKALTSL